MRGLRQIIATSIVGILVALIASVQPASADDWVNPTGPAEGVCLASGTGGLANGCFGPTFAVSGTGSAGAVSCWKTALSLSLLGAACSAPDGQVWVVDVDGVAVSGTGTATSDWVAVSGTNNAYGVDAVSFTGDAYGSAWAVSGTGDANGYLAVSLFGDASGTVRVEGVDTVFYARGYPNCSWGNQGATYTDEIATWTCGCFHWTGEPYCGWFFEV